MPPIRPPHRDTSLRVTGERYLPSVVRSVTGLEHYHRYLLATTLVEGRSVLDVACGEGYGAYMLAQAASSVIGVDVDVETVAAARRKYGSEGRLRFVAGDCAWLPFPDDSVDRVVSFETLEHVSDFEGFLDEVRRVLRPDGILCISSPNKGPYNRLFPEHNDYHERELEHEEFVELLRGRFPHVVVGQQQALFASWIDVPGSQRRLYLEQREDGCYHGVDSLDRLAYSVALASREPVEGRLPASWLLDTTFDGSAHTYSEDAAIYEIRDPAILRYKGDLERLERKHATLVSEMEVVKSVRASLEERLSELRGELAADRRERREIEAALAKAQQSLGQVRSALEAVAAERDRVAEELVAVRSSLSWRCTAPVRRVVSVVGWMARLLGAGRVRRTLGTAARRGPANTMEPIPRRVLSSSLRAIAKAALFLQLVRPAVARATWRIRRSGLLDPQDYRERYLDVADLGDLLCAVHYAAYGWREGRRPGPGFDPDFYSRQNPAVRDAGVNPLLHYVLHGKFEGRAPVPCAAAPGAHVEPEEEGFELPGSEPPVATPASGPRVRRGKTTVPVGAERDHWSGYRDFRAYIARRRAEVRRAFAPVRPRSIDFAKGDPATHAARVDRELRPSPSPRVSVVIPVHGQIVATLECLASIARAPVDVDFEVVVVDDASPPHESAVLEGMKSIRLLRNDEQQGFGRSCNRGVEAARGEFVVLLNSDTQVSAHWLDALVEPMVDDPSVGIVGPRLVFPDGLLQEAGGRLRFDGSGDMVGLWEDPEAPRFSFSRRVDYVSGACLAVRRADFLAVGGFDDAYSPAYCEDADLCLALQERGKSVLYQPRARVVHHLSRTADAKGRRHKLELAFRHQQVLSRRWGDRLEERDQVRVLAFYLPQFHATPENDRWWGEGFTEWRNVTRARPRFRGHFQPRLPGELGFYDLTTPGVMERQAELARAYGVYGFAIYYYRLGGRRILSWPLERILADPEWSFPFCLVWANENWTRRWDGEADHVLAPQIYGAEEDEALIEDFVRHFRHPGYVRVHGKPLLLVYRPLALPEPAATLARWRERCRSAGIGEIYVVGVETFELVRGSWNPCEHGYDASVEFPPHESGQPVSMPRERMAPDYHGVVHDYRRVVEAFCTREMPAYKRLRGVMPGWDNTARSPRDSHVFVHAGPAEYQVWLEHALEDTRAMFTGEERMVFVNAWNEWAEGAYLEPDLVHGRAYLEATRNALRAERWEP